MNSALEIAPFKTLDTDPGGTLKKLTEYLKQMELLFKLIFRKSDGTAYTPTDDEKKSLLLLKGGSDMENLFVHVGKVLDNDSYDAAVKKVKDGLADRTNRVVQRNMLFANHAQGTKSFERWSQEVSNAAKLIDYTNYDWETATVDAIIMQTSNPKLRERALQDNVSYDQLIKLGISKEQSARGAAMLEEASGQATGTNIEEEVRRLRFENNQLKSKNKMCTRCLREDCPQGNNCFAQGAECDKCHKMNHFGRACRTGNQVRNQDSGPQRRYQDNRNQDSGPQGRFRRKKKTKSNVRKVDDETDSDESLGRIITVNQVGKSRVIANIEIQAETGKPRTIPITTDTGVRKTLLGINDWNKISNRKVKLKKCSKGFRPYGTTYKLPIIGKAKVTLKCENGATIDSTVWVVNDKKESSLLGEEDAIRLGIVTINLKGAEEEVVGRIEYQPKSKPIDENDIVSGGETQKEIDENMKILKQKLGPDLFTNKTGKYTGNPIPIQLNDKDELITPVIQPGRKIPLQYREKLDEKIKEMLDDDIIEGPIDIEEPGTFISNLVITDKKGSDDIRVTLDCQSVNKVLYATHEPIPTVEELRHKMSGSDRFSVIDLTNCYFQFEIEEKARKLFAFRTPNGIFRFKRCVQGANLSSSEIQKRIREIIKDCSNAIHIKDDIKVHGKGKEHDIHLEKVLKKLKANGLTLRPKKCDLGKTEVKWFGYIFSKDGMSPDPEKCSIIKNWPAPKSCTEVKSFLQTVQFHSKFLGACKPNELTYPELTRPLREMTKKHARFVWGKRESSAFEELKCRLCSDKVLAPFDTSKPTRLYVDSSFLGTQATLAQLHSVNDEEVWKPVNHTSRAWTPPESRYSQIERESNGVLTGMCMNKMYTLGTQVEVVTDHKPLLKPYNSPRKPKQLRIDRHRTKLLPYNYSVSYEPGKLSPCDYGSRHPPQQQFSEKEIEEWEIETEVDIYVNRVLEESLPEALPIKKIRKQTNNDPILQSLIADLTSQRDHCVNPSLKEYHAVFSELTECDGIVLRGNQVVLPRALYADAIALAHEGHQYSDKTLKLLRETCWFPGMRKQVLDYVESCDGCAAALPHITPVPLQPNLLPSRAWENLHADFKGPIGGQYYLHIVIDQYSKYPEVDVVKSTSFAKLRTVLDRIFATHGIPEKLSSDNGPPYPSHDMEKYAAEMGFELTPVSPNDPQGNGFAENFVKSVCKLLHTAIAEKKDVRGEISKYLLQYRATPHSTTGKSPAEMLYGRKLKTKLPLVVSTEETQEQKATRERHDEQKLKQKKHFDRRHRAKQRSVKPGDRVIVKQKKTTTKPPFDPVPWTVESTKGNRVHMKRPDGNRRVRDMNHIKKLNDRPSHLVPSWDKCTADKKHTDYNQFEIEFSLSPSSQATNTVGDTVNVSAVHQVEQTIEPEISSDVSPDFTILNLGEHTFDDQPNQPDDEDAHTPSISNKMQHHLQQLLQAAESRATRHLDEHLTAVPLCENMNTSQSTDVTLDLPLMQSDGPTLIDAAMNNHSQQPTQQVDSVAVTASDYFHRTTRSEGQQLRWNPVMNSGPALLDNAEGINGSED